MAWRASQTTTFSLHTTTGSNFTRWGGKNRYVENLFTDSGLIFIGNNPIPQPDDPLEMAWYKQVNGLTLEQLGVKMGRDPEQLADWLSGRHNPCQRNRKEIEVFLAELDQASRTTEEGM